MSPIPSTVGDSQWRWICLGTLVLLTELNICACKCLEVGSPAEAFPKYEMIFAGTVIEITPYVYEDPPPVDEDETDGLVFVRQPFNQVTFRVIETWKGTNSSLKVLLTGTGGGDCGYGFRVGSDYLVYASGGGANGIDGFTSICTRTSLLLFATADRQYLGDGLKPLQPLLNVRREINGMIFSWHTNWTNFRLEATQSLLPPVMWQPVSTEPTALADAYVVTNETVTANSFFRLARWQ